MTNFGKKKMLISIFDFPIKNLLHIVKHDSSSLKEENNIIFTLFKNEI
jgi:hypothetical protein